MKTILSDNVKSHNSPYDISRTQAIISLLINVILSLSLFLIDGYQIYRDTPGYIHMSIVREPLYPLFLLTLRTLFSSSYYLPIVAFIQCILSGLSIWIISYIISNDYDKPIVLFPLLIICQYIPIVATRFVANRRAAYSTSILTEGLGIPLFIIFIILLYRYIINKNRHCLILLSISALLLCLLRKQLIISIIILIVAFTLDYLIMNKSTKRYLLLLLLSICILLSSKIITRTYNLILHNQFIENTGKLHGILSTLIYTSDWPIFPLDDYPDQDSLEYTYIPLLNEILSQAQEQELQAKYAPSDINGIYEHYSDCYDAIGYGIIIPTVDEYINAIPATESTDLSILMDSIYPKLARLLIVQDKTNIIITVACNIFAGLMNTISKNSYILNPINCIIFISYILLMIIEYRRYRISSTLILVSIILISITINVSVVGLTIFAQNRYMIYNSAAFYIGWVLLAHNLISYQIKKRQH